MNRESESRALMFKSKRCVVSAKLTNQSREKGRVWYTTPFSLKYNKRCSSGSYAYVFGRFRRPAQSGKESNPPMRPTNTYDETRGNAAKHPTAAKFGGVGQ